MLPAHGNPRAFAHDYIDALTAALGNLDRERVAAIIEVLWEAYQADRQIFFFGNGGSAATASHVATDLSKGALGHRGDAPAPAVRAIALTDNVALLTAWANDVGYDSVFLGPLRAYLRPGDVVVAISASGNSPNVLRAIEHANQVGATTIGLAGLGGGKLATLVTLGIVVDSQDYGIVEDVHLQIAHMIAFFFRQRIQAGLEAQTRPVSSA